MAIHPGPGRPQRGPLTEAHRCLYFTPVSTHKSLTFRHRSYHYYHPLTLSGQCLSTIDKGPHREEKAEGDVLRCLTLTELANPHTIFVGGKRVLEPTCKMTALAGSMFVQCRRCCLCSKVAVRIRGEHAGKHSVPNSRPLRTTRAFL